jgi:hypothetical protein
LGVSFSSTHVSFFIGIIIFTADDLTYTKIPVKADDEFNDHMWAWLLHSVLSTGDVSHENPKNNMAGRNFT